MKAGGCVFRKRLSASRTGKQQMKKQSSNTENAVSINHQGGCVTVRNRWRDTRNEREWNGERERGSEGAKEEACEEGRREGMKNER